jgi:MFS family permease
VLLVAVSFQAAVMLVFATAGGVPMLVAARAVQGLATGAALGALGAAMVDLDKAKGTIANAVAPASGTAIGGLGSGLLVQYAPSPTHLVYLVLFAIFVAQVVGVVLMPESSAPTPGALASLRPTLALPAAVRRPIVAAVPALVAVWALAGFYGSLGPALTRLVTGSDSLALGGLSLFVLLGTAAVTVLTIRTTGPRSMMVLGVVALFVGVGTTLVAISQGSTAAFFAGTAVSGVGFGAGFQGALGTVLPCAAPHQRAGVLSVLLMVSYFALGVPAVIAGILVVEVGGVLTTAREYGVAVMVLAALALVALTRAHSGPQLAPPNALSAVDGDLLARAGCRP